MNDEYKILTMLIESFWDSAKGRGKNKINRSTRLKPEKIDADYHKNTGNADEKYRLEEAAGKCEDLGFVQLKHRPYSDEITDIILSDDKVPDIEKYLEANYPEYEPRDAKEKKMNQLAISYRGNNPLCDFECERVLTGLADHKIKYSYYDEDDLLRSLAFIGSNEQTLYLREASMKIFGPSKRLGGGDGEEGRQGRVLLNRISKTCADFLQKFRDDSDMPDDVLREFNIIQDRQKIGIKGKGYILFKQDGKELFVNITAAGVEIYVDELTEYSDIHIDTPVFMTVENHYSWARSEDPDITYFDLQGFKDRAQREFIKAVYQANPSLSYLHFGDIDAGGFRIYKDLCESTGVPFEMYKMSDTELADKRYEFCLKSLTEEDKKRLKSFLNNSKYHDTVAYMLEHNIKLEQEIISLTEWMDGHK